MDTHWWNFAGLFANVRSHWQEILAAGYDAATQFVTFGGFLK